MPTVEITAEVVAKPAIQADHNPRGCEKTKFDPAETVICNERTVAERMNARLKDEFGGNTIWVKGNAKVISQLMFGVSFTYIRGATMPRCVFQAPERMQGCSFRRTGPPFPSC